MKKSHTFKLKLISIITLAVMLCGFLFNFSKTEYKYFNIPEVKHMNAIGAADTLTDTTLLRNSTLDTLQLNFSTLPEVTATGSYNYTIAGQDGVKSARPGISNDSNPQVLRSITFTNLPHDQEVDIGVKAKFNNCGTLNGRAIDLVIEYSDFYSGSKWPNSTSTYYVPRNDTKVLWWTSYGTTDKQVPVNEWFWRGFESFNMKAYFYYHGETTPINLDTAYFSMYSLSGNAGSYPHSEGISSSTATRTYLFESPEMAYMAQATYGTHTYKDIYYGRTDQNATVVNDEPKKAAVSFEFQNTDHIDVNMFALQTQWSAGYHVNFYAMSATLPEDPIKMSNPTELSVGEELTYTVLQNMPFSRDGTFKLDSMVFSDSIDTDSLEYKTLKVYDDTGQEVTSTAGTTAYTDGLLTYTFNPTYLNTITFKEQQYKFVITADVKTNLPANTINNIAQTTFNSIHTLTSNTAVTDVVSYVVVKYVDENDLEISEPLRIKGKVYEPYTTEKKEIEHYDFVSAPENATGTYACEETEVIYKYRKNVKDVTIIKLWNDNNYENRPTSVHFTLLRKHENEVEEPIVVAEADLTAENNWAHTFTDIPKYIDSTSTEQFEYKVNETDWTGGYYITEISQIDDVFTVTNTKYGEVLINKFDNSTKTPLAGAKFRLEMKEGEEWIPLTNDNLDLNNTTDMNGQLAIDGLKQGLYRIFEIKAPQSYQLNDEIYEFEINSTNFEYIIDVPNKKSVELPRTGGEGTSFIILSGAIIVLFSAFFNIRNRRIKNEVKKCKFKHRY